MISENFVPVAGYRPAELAWSATDIAILTGGRWVVPPSDSAGWKMTGLCATPPPSHTTTTTTQINACQHLMLLASTGEVGLSLHQIERLCTKAAGIISQAGGEHDYVSYGAPLLEVVNLRQAVTDLAAAARRQFQGTVIGVTGSVGKTSTVAMIGHALAGVGKCDRSRTSANGFYAIGWNLASMDRGADFWVQEMSVHNMDICSRLVRPDAAIITAIAPAHLADFRNTETVARFKARIYNGMTPGAIVVINGDMDEFGVIEPLARAAGLRVVRFGAHESSHAQFLSMDRATVHAKILGKTCSFTLGAPGRHMAMNALAVLGTIAALGHSIEAAAAQLSEFMPLIGRGKRSNVIYKGKAIEIWDESYNANPGSMRAALQMMRDAADTIPRKSRVLVLGDMLELGPDAQQLHLALEADIRALEPDRVLLCGPLMQALAQRLLPDFKVSAYPDVNHMLPAMENWLEQGDVVLVKSSNGIKLGKIVDHLVKNHLLAMPNKGTA